METEKRLIDEISEAIVAQLRGEHIEEPVYGVILVYTTQAEEELCPWVAVGTQREREAFLREEEEPDLLLWSGESLESYNPVESLLEDADFLDRCAQWKQEAHRDDRAELRITAMMQRICFRLMKYQWREIFPITEDFAITACTQEGDWLMDNMSVLLPKEQFDRFLEQGYLFAGCGGCEEDEAGQQS